MQYSELFENKKHGTPDFPIEYYHIDKSHPAYVMKAHWHNELELIRVISGELAVYLNNTRYDLTAGGCLLVEGGCLKRADPTACVYECLVFDAVMLDGHLGNISECEFVNLIAPGDGVIIATVDRLFSSVSSAGEFYELEVRGLLYKLFYNLYTLGYVRKRGNAYLTKGVRTVVSILEWIENHITEPITLSRISEFSGVSEKYLCRIFKEHTSRTVMEYVNESRIEHACAVMVSLSVTDAAFSSGFNDLSYFSKTFKKYKGVTPSEYKHKYHKTV